MISMFDARLEYLRLQDEIDTALRRVCLSEQLILGPEVEAFEAEFAAYVGSRHAVGVNSGTDALQVALRALEIGPGDEVLTVSHTAVPTVAAVRAVGALPRFVDVEPTHLLMDPDRLEAAIGPRTRCLLPVHLYGHPADMERIGSIAARHGLPVIADCAQALGARLHARHVGGFATIACYSFYPTKNLGALGDGGLCTTDDSHLAARLRRIRCYGFDSARVAECEGLCSRLDELQAAVLRVKLRHLDSALQRRQRLALRYRQRLAETGCGLPTTSPWARHAFHLFVIRCAERARMIARLDRRRIHCGIHYPTPVHLMPAYAFLGYRRGDLPVTERAADEVLSLPLHYGLKEADVDAVVDALLDDAPSAALTRAGEEAVADGGGRR